jgi:hypothetical protein
MTSIAEDTARKKIGVTYDDIEVSEHLLDLEDKLVAPHAEGVPGRQVLGDPGGGDAPGHDVPGLGAGSGELDAVQVVLAIVQCKAINTGDTEEEVTIQVEAVAKSTIEKYEQFWACGQCGKVYFEGSHWEKATQQAKKLIKN